MFFSKGSDRMKHAKRNIYSILVTIAFSVIIATACSSSPEKTDTEASTHHKASTENTSSHEDESILENNTSATGDNSSLVETTTITGSQNETTTSNNAGNNGSGSNSSGNGSGGNSGGNSSGGSSGGNGSGGSSGGNSSGSSSNSGNVFADKNSDKIVLSYGGATSTEEKKLAQAVINKIITKGMSEFEKAKAIHDYMVMNIDYDYDDYLANTIPNDSYNVMGALKNKYAVCAGYAKTFKLLCELAGLECTYVTGTAGGPHAWNRVKVDGKWYNIDVTWDDPVSTGKAFDDHKYNRYSYFLISDQLMYKDHKTNNAKHTCSSSLNAKAYELGAPWFANTYTYVKNEAELAAVAKKAVQTNSTSISIIWDTNWIKTRDMSSTIKGMLLEFALYDFSMTRYSYVTIPNTTYCSSTFTVELKNGSYTAISKLCTADDIKNLIVQLKKGNPDQMTVPMANELVNDDIFYKVAVWAFEEHDLSIGFHETTIPINSTTKSVHVHAFKNTYHGDYHANEAYHAKTTADIMKILAEQHTYNGSFRVVYRYGDELGRLTSDQLDNYITKNLAPSWASKYCYESYETSTDDFVCVTVITFHNARHSTSGMKWEYSKEPTCIESGTSILKCAKCGNITQSHEVEATGKHTTYWVYENDGTKHLSCKHCTYTGPKLYQYGDAWGYYDNNAASQLFTSVNEARESAIYYNIDSFGNLIGCETPPQLTLDSSLTKELEKVVLQAAWLGFSNSTSGYNFDSNIAIIDGNFTLERASSTLTTASSHLRELFNNKYLTRAGVCCFYYDKDGTGLNMSSIWCIYYGE